LHAPAGPRDACHAEPLPGIRPGFSHGAPADVREYSGELYYALLSFGFFPTSLACVFVLINLILSSYSSDSSSILSCLTLQKSHACLGSAVKAAYEIGKLLGGKMLLFSSAIPTIGLGKLDEKYDQKLIGTPKVTFLYSSFLFFF
jgi:hypothetical protein